MSGYKSSKIIKITGLAAYTAAHFCVDLCCFYILFARFYPAAGSLYDVSLGFLCYNAIAFGLQFLLGSLADKKRLPLGSTGAAICFVSLAINISPALSLALCALGNASFHAGGGASVLKKSGGRSSDGGIFVATGALGVFAGTYLGRRGAEPLIPLSLILIAAAVTAAAETADIKLKPDYPEYKARSASDSLSVAAVLTAVLAAVLIRSYGGAVMPAEWKTDDFSAFIFVLAAFAGKAAGGILADLLGAKNTASAALIISVALGVAAGANEVAGALAVFFFNIPMAITLSAAADRLPANEGLAFGLTTLCLLLGSMPTFFFYLPESASAPVFASLTAAAAVALFVALKNDGAANKKTARL